MIQIVTKTSNIVIRFILVNTQIPSKTKKLDRTKIFSKLNTFIRP